MRQTTLCNGHINERKCLIDCFKSRNRIFALGRLLNIPVGAFRPISTSLEALGVSEKEIIPFNINPNTLIGFSKSMLLLYGLHRRFGTIKTKYNIILKKFT